MGAKRPVPAGKGRQTPLPLNSSPLPALKARRIWELEYKDGKGQIFEGKPGSYSPHPLIAQSRRLEPSRRSFSLNFLTPFPLHRAFNALMDGPPFREVGNGDFEVEFLISCHARRSHCLTSPLFQSGDSDVTSRRIALRSQGQPALERAAFEACLVRRGLPQPTNKRTRQMATAELESSEHPRPSASTAPCLPQSTPKSQFPNPKSRPFHPPPSDFHPFSP